jgi:hypothetical protein
MKKLECKTFYDGSKSWWLNGKLHRLDGPAIEWVDGSEAWWVNGKRCQTKEEHAKLAFLWMTKHTEKL